MNKNKKSNRRKKHRRSADVAAKATAYSLATGATLCLVGDAQAAPVQYEPPGGGPVVIDEGTSFLVDFDGGLADVRLSRDFGGGNSTADSAYGIGAGAIFTTLGYGSSTAAFLTAGEQVGTDVTDWTSPVDLSEFVNRRGFLGLRFEGGDGENHFAYLDISFEGANVVELNGVPLVYFGTLTLYGGAFESDPDTAIATVPEPGSLALLALGAAGLATRRRRDELVAS